MSTENKAENVRFIFFLAMIPWFNVFFISTGANAFLFFFFHVMESWKIFRTAATPSKWLHARLLPVHLYYSMEFNYLFFFFSILMFSWYYVRITSGKQMMEKVFGIWNVVVGTNQNDVKSFTPGNRAGTKWSVKTALICEFWEIQSSFTVDVVLH